MYATTPSLLMFSEISAWMNARCTILDDTTVYAASNIAHEALIHESLSLLCTRGLILHVAYSSMHQHQSRYHWTLKLITLHCFTRSHFVIRRVAS